MLLSGNQSQSKTDDVGMLIFELLLNEEEVQLLDRLLLLLLLRKW